MDRGLGGPFGSERVFRVWVELSTSRWNRLATSQPYAVENCPVREYSDVEVRLEDGVECTNFLISKKRIWHPDPAGIRHGQVSYSI